MSNSFITTLSNIFLRQPLYFTIIFFGLSFFICVLFKGWPSYLSDCFTTNEEDEEDEEYSYTVSINNFKLQIGDNVYRASTDFEIKVEKNN